MGSTGNSRTRPLVLGLSASLRNARFGAGSEALVEDLKALKTREELDQYLGDQAKICLSSFVEAGRADDLPFDTIYRNLQKRRGDRGLSNSEVALAAGLWGVKNQGVDIQHIGLSNFFPPNSAPTKLDELKERLLEADGILLAGPVYFGDRGSIAQSFIEMIRNDKELTLKLQNKLYSGISVGAKRNGGQETTLIYQMIDMSNLGFLLVGNDAGTTSQYGGTGVAGDVGTMADDAYGINTSIGTGNRLGQVANLFHGADEYGLKRKVRVAVWLLQDRDNFAEKKINDLISQIDPEEAGVEFNVMNFTEEQVRRCIACDICPTHVSEDQEYRCIIKHSKDLFAKVHNDLIDTDAILMSGFSPREYAGLKTIYQKFIERTRYLRRGDYVLSNLLATPLVFDEIGSRENLSLRMMTSLIRHNTIISRPIIAHTHEGEILNKDATLRHLLRFVQNSRYSTIGSLKAFNESENVFTVYNPIGYVMSEAKDREEVAMKIREKAVEDRFKRRKELANDELVSVSDDKWSHRKGVVSFCDSEKKEIDDQLHQAIAANAQ